MVTLIGKGAWAHALSSLLEENNKEYNFWDKESEIDPKNVIVLAVPAQAIREVLEQNKNSLKEAIIINTAKGIEKETNMLPFEIAKEVLGEDIKYSAMLGPSFASEVEQKMPTFINLCCMGEEETICPLVRNYFQTDYFRVRQTRSVQAIELAGAFKNIYAIACGITLGLGFGENTRAQLVVLAYEETIKLCKAIGYEVADDAVEGIMGDLVLTCGSLVSRNFMFGKLLSKLSVSDALNQIGSTVEGFKNAYSVPFFQEKSGLDLKLANFVYETLVDDSSDRVEKRFLDLVKKV